jgi:Protein of unknown function (DUF2785)
MIRFWLLIGVGLAPLLSANAAETCPPKDYSRQELLALQAKQFQFVNDDKRNTFALSLLPCLANVDPTVRDGIAFEALSALMRGKHISATTGKKIFDELLPWLKEDFIDRDGVARPFAALTLAEVARMDRIEAFLSTQQREALIAAGSAYLESVRDYRGYDEQTGWRHGVAHGSDLLLQLALNEKVGRADIEQILNAVATQIVPRNQHFYIYGESERLARPVYYVAQRGLLDGAWWNAWLNKVASPLPYGNWSEIYQSQSGLAKRHNTASFLTALYVYTMESGDASTKEKLLPALVAAMKQLP